jgi:prepilin-type processing-associated H-X9-DG protein
MWAYQKARHSSTNANVLYNDCHEMDLHLAPAISHNDAGKENIAPPAKQSDEDASQTLQVYAPAINGRCKEGFASYVD